MTVCQLPDVSQSIAKSSENNPWVFEIGHHRSKIITDGRDKAKTGLNGNFSPVSSEIESNQLRERKDKESVKGKSVQVGNLVHVHE